MSHRIAIVGLGYVGLPLALEFGKYYQTMGYDCSTKKIAQYQSHCDPSGEMATAAFHAATHLTFTTDPTQLTQATVIIIAVPTPVNQAHIPDFSLLKTATIDVAKQMKKNTLVIYESTVYPGATEEICIPLLEKHSNKQWQRDFHVGYSPERINPGDPNRSLKEIVKVVSGDNQTTLEVIATLYQSIITAGVHRAPSIKIAEAAKVIENTQRDINIALMNELAQVFQLMAIDTQSVLEAASTKWNFMPFQPGLVGGHCIGVDPYYLTYKAEMLGYHPQMILAGRRINDCMATYVAQQTIKKMITQAIPIKQATIIVLGLTFKENCADLRNSKVFDLITELQSFGCTVWIHDPMADPLEAKKAYQLHLTDWADLPSYADAMIAAVSHYFYLNMPLTMLLEKLKPEGLFVDVKSNYQASTIEETGKTVWRL